MRANEAMSKPVFVLGGYQTDFAINWSRTGQNLYDIMRVTVEGALAAADIEPHEVETAHVGNFVAELIRGQGHLGGLFASIHPAFAGVPASRHEAACASGSVAVLAAAAEIEAERYDLALVIGIEEMRNVPVQEATNCIGAPAAWNGREAERAQFVWPYLFSELVDEYDRRYGIRYEHLARIAQNNFGNARRNPNAQTRKWAFNEHSFEEDDEHNPVIEGRVRKHDCGQVTDGAAAIFVASERYAAQYARRKGTTLDGLPRITGWGHRTMPLRLADKLVLSRGEPYIFPHVRRTIQDAFRRAGLAGAEELDGFETHDCFTVSEYMAIDHLGLTPPGESWRAIESGEIELGGRLPINPSGGLIGLGHPVGATGTRMLLDAYKQVTGIAGDYQVEGAKTFGTLNIGGSATTTVSFVVGV